MAIQGIEEGQIIYDHYLFKGLCILFSNVANTVHCLSVKKIYIHLRQKILVVFVLDSILSIGQFNHLGKCLSQLSTKKVENCAYFSNRTADLVIGPKIYILQISTRV